MTAAGVEAVAADTAAVDASAPADTLVGVDAPTATDTLPADVRTPAPYRPASRPAHSCGARRDPYDDAIAALYARRPDRLVRSLHRIRALVGLLGDPQRSAPAVHVTGTNGKGSVATLTGAILAAHGLTVGTYTSPHVDHVRERIRIDATPVAPATLEVTLGRLAAAVETVDATASERLTFFEVLTAAAAQVFADAGVDVGVWEVGRGGALDATNVVEGDVAVLTPIGGDHTDLWPTPLAAAVEKAGIVAPGAFVVSGPQRRDVAAHVAAVASARGGRLVRFDRDFGVVSREPCVGGQVVGVRTVGGQVLAVPLPLLGAHQAVNLACAVAAVEGLTCVAGVPLDADAVRYGARTAVLTGRCEVVRRGDGPPVLLDVAHNRPSAAALATVLRDDVPAGSRVVVAGLLGDKDVEGIVEEVARAADLLVVVPAPSHRAAPPQRVLAASGRVGLPAVAAPDLGAGFAHASVVAGRDPRGLVAVTGGCVTVGAVRDLLHVASGGWRGGVPM